MAYDGFVHKYNPAKFRWGKYKPFAPERVVVHCSATKASMDIGVDWIDFEHTKRGMSGVGYHYVIRRNGTIEGGRPSNLPGAHAVGFNLNSFGVCLVGGLDEKGRPENNFTDAQFGALHTLVMQLVDAYGLHEVLGHRDLYGDTNKDGVIDHRDWLKDCPCFDVRKWVEQHRDLITLIHKHA